MKLLVLGYALLWTVYLAPICEAFFDGLFIGDTLLCVLLPRVCLLWLDSRLGFDKRGANDFLDGEVAMVSRSEGAILYLD